MLLWLGLRRHGRLEGAPVYIATARGRRLFFRGGTVAFVFWGVVVFRSRAASRERSIREHERQHLIQRRQLGAGVFEVVYWLMYIYKGYWNNPLEVSARRVADED